MNTAHITVDTLTLEIAGVTHTEQIADIESGRKRLISIIPEKVPTQATIDLVVYVEGEEPIGLRCSSGNLSKIDVPQEKLETSSKPLKGLEEPQSSEVIDSLDGDDLDIPVLKDKTISDFGSASHARLSLYPHSASLDEHPVTPALVSNAHKPTAEQFYTAKPNGVEAPARNGWRGFLNSLGLSLSADAEELAERKARREIQRGLKSHKTIMVANLKGGAGKTTIAYLLSSVLGRVRGGTVLAWDNNENRGTLAYRSPLEANTTSTAIDLLHEMNFFEKSGKTAELINFVRPQGENKFDLLASQHQGSDKPVINGDGFILLHNLLRSFYRMIVVDTGNASNASTWQAAAAIADELVIVCSNTEDSAQTAAETIDALIKKGYQKKVENSVATIIDSAKTNDRKKSKENKERLERIQNHLSQHVRVVHVLPWESSLENGGAIEWDRLGIKTHRALLEATASVVSGL